MGTGDNVFRLLRMTRVNATEHPVRVSDLANRYASTTTFEDVSLAVEDGETFGFQAPNSAGETALLKRTRGPRHKFDDTTARESQREFTSRKTAEQPVPREAAT